MPPQSNSTLPHFLISAECCDNAINMARGVNHVPHMRYRTSIFVIVVINAIKTLNHPNALINIIIIIIRIG